MINIQKSCCFLLTLGTTCLIVYFGIHFTTKIGNYYAHLDTHLEYTISDGPVSPPINCSFYHNVQTNVSCTDDAPGFCTHGMQCSNYTTNYCLSNFFRDNCQTVTSSEGDVIVCDPIPTDYVNDWQNCEEKECVQEKDMICHRSSTVLKIICKYMQ
jgi:hypothetical protein